MASKKRRYTLIIRLYEKDEGGELVSEDVFGADPDDAIGHGDAIVKRLLNERLNFNLKAKIIKCRPADYQTA